MFVCFLLSVSESPKIVCYFPVCWCFLCLCTNRVCVVLQSLCVCYLLSVCVILQSVFRCYLWKCVCCVLSGLLYVWRGEQERRTRNSTNPTVTVRSPARHRSTLLDRGTDLDTRTHYRPATFTQTQEHTTGQQHCNYANTLLSRAQTVFILTVWHKWESGW